MRYPPSPATLTDLVTRTIILSRTLARTLSTIETRDPAHDALLHRVIAPLKTRDPFDGLDETGLAELEALLEHELAHETRGVKLRAGSSVTIGEETVYGDLYTAPRLTARENGSTAHCGICEASSKPATTSSITSQHSKNHRRDPQSSTPCRPKDRQGVQLLDGP